MSYSKQQADPAPGAAAVRDVVEVTETAASSEAANGASGRAMRTTVYRFSSAQSELSRWYTAEINHCTVRATPVEKAAIAQAMRSF